MKCFYETFQWLLHCSYGNRGALGFVGRKAHAREADLEGTPEFYREKADSMLKQAQAVQSYEARAELLKLAEQWERLAQIVGHPNW
jgi:hypothetical protein